MDSLAYSPTRLLAYSSALLMLSEPAFSEPAFISPPVWDLAEDSDQDGLRDVDELLMFGMDPLDPSDGLSDDDGDLLSMAWEIFYETDPNFSDTDEDTWSDGEELLFYGTDPLDPQSFPQGIDENDPKTTENPSSSTTFTSQPTAALVQTPPPPSLSNGEFNDLVVTNFRHNTGKDYQGKVFDWGSGAGDANGWIAYNGSLIEVWKSGDERFIELDGWSGHFGVKQPIANVVAGSYVLTWQQSGRTNLSAGGDAYKVQVYYLKNGSEVKIAETGYIAGIDKTKWTPNGLGFSITEEQIADAAGSPIYVAFIPKDNNTYGTLIDKVQLVTVEVVIPKVTPDGKELVVANELKVSKMEGAIIVEKNAGEIIKEEVHIDKDIDRFYIRISGGSALADGKGVSAKIKTSENNDAKYNDDETSIKLVAENGDLISKSLMITSDAVDDGFTGDIEIGVDNQDLANDRTHLIQLGGQLVISKVKIGDIEVDLKLRKSVRKKKRVTVNFVILNDGKVNVADVTAEIKRDLVVANERYAQVGIEIVSGGIILKDTPDGLRLPNGQLQIDASDGQKLSDDSRQIIETCGTVGDLSDIHAIYLPYELRNNNGGNPKGVAITSDYFNEEPSDVGYLDNIFIRIGQPLKVALAHEVGHVLSEEHVEVWAEVGDVYWMDRHRNLMTAEHGLSDENRISGPLRLWKVQEERMHSSIHSKDVN